MPRVLPCEFRKHHPTAFWVNGNPTTPHMEHAVAPEMDLFRLTEQGVYEKLLRLVDRQDNGGDGGDRARCGLPPVVFEMDELVGEREANRRLQTTDPAATACRDLVNLLDQYDVLEHSRRRPRRIFNRAHQDVEQSEEDLTSDEESLDNEKSRLRVRLGQLKGDMYQKIDAERRRTRWPALYDSYLRIVEPRLRRISLDEVQETDVAP